MLQAQVDDASRIFYGGGNLEPVADDACVSEKPRSFSLAVGGHRIYVEAVVCPLERVLFF
jgi:hypothetical protein